jgi:tetratricopeptide (TPR) repeat protein
VPQESNNISAMAAKYDALVEKNPDSAVAHMKLGTTLISLGKTKRAEEELRKAIEIDPTCVPAWINLGGILLARWDFKGCVEANEQALEANPELAMAHYNKGLGHLYLNEPEAMVGCFERATELEADNAGAHYHLAVGRFAQKDVERARKSLAKAINLGYKPEPRFLKALEDTQNNAGGDPPVMELVPKPNEDKKN